MEGDGSTQGSASLGGYMPCSVPLTVNDAVTAVDFAPVLSSDDRWVLQFLGSQNEVWVQGTYWIYASFLFTGTVMTSFNHVMIPTRGKWFQTNPPEHESDDRADLLCVLQVVKIWHFSSKLDQLLWLFCPENQLKSEVMILILVRVLWGTISKIYWQIWQSFFKCTFKSSFIFYSSGVMCRKWHIQFVWNQCQGNHDVCMHDVSLYQRITVIFSLCFLSVVRW